MNFCFSEILPFEVFASSVSVSLAGPLETTNVATKQKQLIEGFKSTLQHSQVNANVISKAFNDPGTKK